MILVENESRCASLDDISIVFPGRGRRNPKDEKKNRGETKEAFQ